MFIFYLHYSVTTFIYYIKNLRNMQNPIKNTDAYIYLIFYILSYFILAKKLISKFLTYFEFFVRKKEIYDSAVLNTCQDFIICPTKLSFRHISQETFGFQILIKF